MSQTGTKLLVRSVCEKKKNPYSGPPPVYQDLSTGHDGPVKNAFVDLPIRLKGKLKHTPGNSLSLLGAQNKDISGASQTLLPGVRLHLQCRLGWSSKCTRKEDYDDPFFNNLNTKMLSETEASKPYNYHKILKNDEFIYKYKL